jgi:signal peptidase I
MSKTRTTKAAAERLPESATHKTVSPADTNGDGMRETIESVVVAFVLAFLFRTFEAEAFVIPTGSMAPTLMGRHKDLLCENCGYPYRVSASDEVDQNGNLLIDKFNGLPRTIDSSTCPMCRYTMRLEGPRQVERYPSYRGDRILVGKFPYEIGDPSRWDVVVFKYPQEAATNYIKRLVGLPGETIWIVHGDILTSTDPDGDFTIARKHPKKLQAMLQMVYDNDYVMTEMIEKGWPARWQPWTVPLAKWLDGDTQADRPVVASPADLPADQWKPSEDYRSYSTTGKSAGPVWLRYQHTVPSQEQWQQLEKGSAVEPQAKLVDDFNAYNEFTINASGSPFQYPHGYGEQPNWVGDLVLDFEAQIASDEGTLTLELIEGNIPFRCQIDVATGKASLSWTGQQTEATADTTLRGRGTYRLAFGNVDDQLTLWVDGKMVSFEGPTTYDSHLLKSTTPGKADFSPAGIGSDGVQMTVNHLCLLRDLYYIAIGNGTNYDNPHGAKFRLEADQFFVLGDNSARSADSRMWDPNERFVHRDLMIGKALYVYWPHSWDKIPGTEIPFPFFPNFERMGFVR